MGGAVLAKRGLLAAGGSGSDETVGAFAGRLVSISRGGFGPGARKAPTLSIPNARTHLGAPAALSTAPDYDRPVPVAEIRVLDLFAGAGGFSRGFHTASERYRNVGAVEFDVHAAASYAANFGNAGLYAGRIEDWLAANLQPDDVDVVIGGPPCQGFSTLGKQDVEDERNRLWESYAETIRRVKPKYFVMENVPAFAKSPQYALFIGMMEAGGVLEDYTFKMSVLNAADYGAAQVRKRVMVIGHRRDLHFPGWPRPTHLGEHVKVQDVLTGVPHAASPPSAWPRGDFYFAGRKLPGPFVSRQLHVDRDYSDLSRKRFAAIPEGGNRFHIPAEYLAPCWVKHTSGSGDVMGRLHWDKPAVTIRTEFFKPEKGRYLHPVADRAITHHEAAILQGFPPEHLFVGSRTAIARQIGNAVPVALGAAIARQIAAVF